MTADDFWLPQDGTPAPRKAAPAPAPRYAQDALFAAPDNLGTAEMFSDAWGTGYTTEGLQ